MLLITFKIGQALPLNFVRILRPRMSRDSSAQQPRKSNGARPRQQPVRDLGLVEVRLQSHSFRKQEQSAIAFCPCPQTRQRIVRGREQASVSARPRSVHKSVESTSEGEPLTKTRRGLTTAKAQPVRCIPVSAAPPTEFPVQIQPVPSHVLV